MRAQLTIENSDHADVFDLEPGQAVTLGRSHVNGIVLHDEHASRQHARVHFENGRWLVADLESRNGTQLDGQMLRRAMPLNHGAEIQIGNTVVRFSVAAETPTSRLGPVTDHGLPLTAPSTTQLQSDELTALCTFMSSAVDDDNAAGLLRRALKALLRQTAASMAGYLSLDADDPVPKLLLPENVAVDRQLSRQLTQKVQRDGRPIWLGRERSDLPSDSLVAFNDALGLPIKARGQAVAAVHVYKVNGRFSEREVRFCEALVGSLAGYLQMLRLRRSLEAENSRLRLRRPDADVLIGDGPAMHRLRQQIARVAAQKFTVLIAGESGVGKELVALAIHRQSQRSNGPLVVKNCAAIPSALMEAELFGYRKGAFTLAERDYPGLFEQADDGTLLFDEIAELPLDCQAKLLRVIDGQPFRPIGSAIEIKPDVRILAATNCDLEKEVQAGRFRSDLYFRLKALTIVAPPLREHAEDIPAIADDYLRRLAAECRRDVRLTPAAIRKLSDYPWPGNVRELQRVLQNAVVNSEGASLDAGALYLSDAPAIPNDLPIDLDEIERVWAIPEALKRTGGNKTQAAKLLGITRETLAKKMEKYGLNGKEEPA
jgi:transcriptional regulator with GAF, ATPase, and Fis domain